MLLKRNELQGYFAPEVIDKDKISIYYSLCNDNDNQYRILMLAKKINIRSGFNEKKVSGLLCSLICSAILWGIADDAYAEEQQSNLDEYVVTASRIPVKKNEVAANVTIIGNEEIEKGTYSKVSDILTANSINMGTSGVGSYPILNGDERVLIMVDGRKMNYSHYNGFSLNGTNIDSIAVKNIERIEIVRGPNSSLYGSAAVGGVINIITKQAKESNTKITTEFGTWNFERYALTTEGVDKDIRYLLTVDKQKRDNFSYENPRTGNNREFNSSEVDKEYVNLRIDKQFGNDNELSLAVESMKDNGGFGIMLADVDTGTVSNPNTRRKLSDSNVALTYSWNKRQGGADSFHIYQNNSEGSTLYPSGSLYDYDLKAAGAEWQQSWMINENYILVGGAELRKEEVKELTGGVNLQGDVTTSAAFIENRWKLNNNYSLTLGNRYDHHSTFGSDVTSHVSLNKALSSDTNVYISWGQAVKNPRILDLYAHTATWLPNPDLKPETSETVTLGMDTKLGKKTSLQASIYQSRLKDAIDWEYVNPVDYVGWWVNVDREKRQGLELNVERNLSDRWNVNAGYSYSKVEKQNGADHYALDLSNSRPNAYSLGVKYNQAKWNVGLTMLAATGRSTEAYTSDSYLTLDMNIRYQATNDTQVYFKGYNLTNEGYEVVSGYPYYSTGVYPMAGRSFIVGVEHRI
ncbi:TonB-dependent receptor plug domain-containing protein [Acetonema longum]|uniref:TonB-dependent receptor n=1 Tax=Acetonema longum DSM 6540 TaxID=1009370 RepID=F7NQA2_9FIRM|nr:TonB-dependent receptor [Acetonema longum]EGO61779.1 TonB-dependent receptor [Acetonema longum DSM 6540]